MAELLRMLRRLRGGNNLSEGQDLAFALDFHLSALTRLLTGGEIPGWAPDGDTRVREGMNDGILRAAAAEPLIEDDAGLVAFDAARFRRRVLDLLRPGDRA